MTKKRKKIDANLIIATGVLLASIGALFVSTRQATIMNRQTQIILEQAKSSAWPSLAIEMTRNIQPDGLHNYFFEISNRGTGPAIVKQTYISYDGEYVSNWRELYDAMNVPDSIRKHGCENFLNRVIKPNEDITLITWTGNISGMNYIYQDADKITISICYASVYGDYWEVKRVGMKTNLEDNITTEREYLKASDDQKFLE